MDITLEEAFRECWIVKKNNHSKANNQNTVSDFACRVPESCHQKSKAAVYRAKKQSCLAFADGKRSRCELTSTSRRGARNESSPVSSSHSSSPLLRSRRTIKPWPSSPEFTHLKNQSLYPRNAGPLLSSTCTVPQISLRLLCYLPTGSQANLACQARNQAEAGDM